MHFNYYGLECMCMKCVLCSCVLVINYEVVNLPFIKKEMADTYSN